MTILYGVTHGVGEMSMFDGWSQSIVKPSRDFIRDLSSLPQGARVGLEWFTSSDWTLVQQDIVFQGYSAGLHYDNIPYYQNEARIYWDSLSTTCKSLGQQIVFLEDPELWVKYNQQVVAQAKQRARNIYIHDGEDDLSYTKRLARHNERNYKAGIRAERIHVLERDDALIKKIAQESLDAVVAGIAHTNSWVSNAHGLQRTEGIRFDRYSTDELISSPTTVSVFTLSANPQPALQYERQSTVRAAKIMDGLNLTDRKPDFIGTWDILFPSQGYFELFIDHCSSGKISGVIEDILGSAEFTGVLGPDSILFDKRYTKATPQAYTAEIRYNGKGNEQQFAGYFWAQGFGRPFCMRKLTNAGIEPLKLSLRGLDMIQQQTGSTEIYRCEPDSPRDA